MGVKQSHGLDLGAPSKVRFMGPYDEIIAGGDEGIRVSGHWSNSLRFHPRSHSRGFFFWVPSEGMVREPQKRRIFMLPKGTLWATGKFEFRPDLEGAWAMDWLGLLTILLSLVGIMAASWVAVRCGIRPPIEQEGEEGSDR